MISYRHADLVNKIGSKPMVLMFNDRRDQHKFYNTVSKDFTDANGNIIDIPADATIFNRNGYIILCDRELFTEHFQGTMVMNEGEVLGLADRIEPGGYMTVGNSKQRETDTID